MFQRCHHKRRGESRLGSAEADGNDDPRHEILRGLCCGRDERGWDWRIKSGKPVRWSTDRKLNREITSGKPEKLFGLLRFLSWWENFSIVRSVSLPVLSFHALDLCGHFVRQADDDLAVHMDLPLVNADLIGAGRFGDPDFPVFDDQMVWCRRMHHRS